MQPSCPSCQLSASPNTLVYRLQLMNTNGWHWKQAEQCYAKLAAKTNPLCWHLLMALPLIAPAGRREGGRHGCGQGGGQHQSPLLALNHGLATCCFGYLNAPQI